MPRDAVLYRVGGPLVALLLALALSPWRDATPASNLTFAFMALVILVAELGGRTAGMATAVASALCLDFFLTRPFLRLAMEDKDDVVALLGFMVCGLIASASRSVVPSAERHPPAAAGDLESAQRVFAAISRRRYRGLASGHLQASLVASLPLWLDAFTHRVPGALVWIALLAQGYCLAMAAGFGVVESRWRRLAGPAGEPDAQTSGLEPDELRGALWAGLAVVSLVPWCYAALGRPATGSVVTHAAAFGAVVLLLLGLVLIVPRGSRGEAAQR